MASFSQTYIILASVHEVWQAIVDPEKINAWGGGPAVMDDKVGTEFELWGGDIWGKNIEVVHHKKLKQEWFAGEWDQPSIVTIDMTGASHQTTIVLTHDQVPDEEQASLEAGWKDSYFEPIKNFLEKK
jgi:activator of HSP90 ATPase